MPAPSFAAFITVALAAVTWSCADRTPAPAPGAATGTLNGRGLSSDSPVPATAAPVPPAGAAPLSGAAPLAVILVTDGDVLNARSAAEVGNPVVAELPPHTTGLIPTGNTEMSRGERWLEVVVPGGGLGWVHSYFTTEHVAHARFCGDPGVEPLLADFNAAVQSRDGAALAALASPRHGLTLRRHWWNPEVKYIGPDLGGIFTADASRDWGVADGTGFPIAGSFNDVAVPLFDRLYGGRMTMHCNDIDTGTGSSAGFRVWPFEYANINYYALYRRAAPGEELNWNTWAVGVEYVDGEPYVAFLVHYQWEI